MTAGFLWQKVRRWREQRVISRRAVPDTLWAQTESRFPFLALPLPADRTRLRELTSLFLGAKQFSGAHGLQVTDEMAVAVAAQACLPVLHLGLGWYDAFVDIVVHEGELVTRREQVDDDGIVHEFDDVFSGEAMVGGPIVLSWEDVQMAGTDGEWGYSVVVHEMAHVIDTRDGRLDGMPPLPDRGRQARWASVLAAAHDQLCDQLDAGQPTAIDPYAETSHDEFFAVACEAFFVTPQRLKASFPALYAELQGFFLQDPGGRAATTDEETLEG